MLEWMHLRGSAEVRALKVLAHGLSLKKQPNRRARALILKGEFTEYACKRQQTSLTDVPGDNDWG